MVYFTIINNTPIESPSLPYGIEEGLGWDFKLKKMKKIAFLFIALFLSVTASFAQSSGVQVIKLNQTTGVFDQTELNLKPGKYIFEITNTDVKQDVGFWLRTPDSEKPIKNSDKGGLIKTGKTVRTGIVELTAGTYTYSCPLNPTPNYKLTVK